MKKKNCFKVDQEGDVSSRLRGTKKKVVRIYFWNLIDRPSEDFLLFSSVAAHKKYDVIVGVPLLVNESFAYTHWALACLVGESLNILTPMVVEKLAMYAM